MGGWEDEDFVYLIDDLARQWMKMCDPLDLIPEEFDSDRQLLIDRNDLDRVASDPEVSTFEGHIVSVVLNIDKTSQEKAPLNLITFAQNDHPIDVLLRSA